MNELWSRPGVKAAAAVALAVLALWLVYAGRAALFPFVVAFCFAYILDPVIDKMESARVNRSAAIVILLVALFAVLAAVAAFVWPIMWSQVRTLAANAPRYVEIVEGKIGPMIDSVPNINRGDVEAAMRDWMGAMGDAPLSALKGAAGWIWSGLTTMVGKVAALFNLVVIPVATFYLLRDFDNITAAISKRIPLDRRERVLGFFRKVDSALSSFFRGQLIVALIMAIMLSTGLLFIGTPMGLLIGVVAGLANIVPYLSIVVGLAPALLLTWLQFGDLWSPLMVLALFSAAQALEGFVISPKVLEEAVGLHPVAVIAALLIGGSFFGFIGVLIAVPVAAVVKVTLMEMDEEYLKSEFYTGRVEKK